MAYCIKNLSVEYEKPSVGLNGEVCGLLLCGSCCQLSLTQFRMTFRIFGIAKTCFLTAFRKKYYFSLDRNLAIAEPY